MEWQEAVKRDIKEGRSLIDLREEISQIISCGVGRDDIFYGIVAIREEFIRSGDDKLEDIALELLDLVEGWCSPNVRL